MAARVRIELNHEGVRALLRSDAVKADLKRRADAVAAKAGPGMVVTTFTGKNRVNASIITATTEARVAEATHRALTRSIDAARA